MLQPNTIEGAPVAAEFETRYGIVDRMRDNAGRIIGMAALATASIFLATGCEAEPTDPGDVVITSHGSTRTGIGSGIYIDSQTGVGYGIDVGGVNVGSDGRVGINFGQ